MTGRAGRAVPEDVLAAGYACVARAGFADTTLATVADEAGISRATLYRWFPGGREELLGQVVAWEHRRFFLSLYGAVQNCSSLEEVMIQGLLVAHRSMESHEVLQMVLAQDSAFLASALSAQEEPTRAQIAAFLVPYLKAHELAPGVDVEATATHLARLFLSLLGAPGRWDLSDPRKVQELVTTEFLAGVVPAR